MSYDLEALKALHAKATQGEWHLLDEYTTLQISDSKTHTNDAAIVHWSGFDSISSKPLSKRKANARYIAALHNAFPAILAELERGRRYETALNLIASWREGDLVTSSFDEPHSARCARAALTKERT